MVKANHGLNLIFWGLQPHSAVCLAVCLSKKKERIFGSICRLMYLNLMVLLIFIGGTVYTIVSNRREPRDRSCLTSLFSLFSTRPS